MDRFSAVSTRKAARLDVARFATRCMAVEDLTLALDIKPRPRLRGGRIAAPCHPADARASPWSAGQWLGGTPPALPSRSPPADNSASRCHTSRVGDQTPLAPRAPPAETPPPSTGWARA